MEKREITDLKIIKEKLFEILVFFDELCKERELKYSLAFGTAIVAVRHAGFIPWDDDIDVLMERSDYEKLILIFEKETFGIFDLKSLHNDKHPFPWLKLVRKDYLLIENSVDNKYKKSNLFIDIFPIDVSPNSIKKVRRLDRKIIFYDKIRLRLVGQVSKNPFKTKSVKSFLSWILTKVIRIFFRKKRVLQKMDKLYTKYSDNYSNFRTISIQGVAKYRLPKECFDEFINISFENKDFLIHKNYDEILRVIYGDYLELPPKEMQVTNHNFTVYQEIGYND